MRWRFLLVLGLVGLVACGSEEAGSSTVSDTGATDDGTDPDAVGGDSDAAHETGTPPDETCIDHDGDGYGPGCELGDDCLPYDPTGHPGAEEICGDGIDNNCNGVIDEGCPCLAGSFRTCYDGPSETLGVGTCRSGYQACENGEWGPCEGQRLPQPETICNGQDTNCNGVADEGLTNACGQCGPVPLEICGDGLDNNCNGVIDEGCDCDDRTNQPCYSGPPQTLGRGICVGGRFDCIDGEWTACFGEVLPEPEICDGIDNNCNGFIDEGVRNACGGCGPVPQEICDGIDNNCNGVIDEGVRLPCGLCPDEVGEEICGDGFDNNCNGFVDEGCPCGIGDASCYPGPPERAGIGACQVGSRSCDISGEFWGACEGFVLPTMEVCDGVDNSCDGLVDIDARGCSVCGTEPEVCDGTDNNCNGFIDEGLRNPCGDCYEDVFPERLGGPDLCDGIDNDCNGFIDEGLLNACGTCDESCYVRDWNTPEGWLEGELEGIDEERLGDGLVLGRTRFTFPDLWIANSGANTITRINTVTPPSVVGTYPSGGSSPSRTAVDFNGDMWVANRAFNGQGTVTKIQSEGCVDEECVVFSVNVGGNNALPRGLAIDREGFAWVGTFNDGRLRRLHPDTGAVVEDHDTGLNIYGIAIDAEGIIWIATISNQGIGAFDTTTSTMLGNWRVTGCSAPYGIAVDGGGNVWFGNWTCHTLGRLDRAAFNRGEIEFETFASGLSNTRGVAVDGDGMIYIASSGNNRLAKFDPTSSSFAWSVETCGTPIGVGIANDGNIWTMCHGSNQAQRFSPAGVRDTTLPTGSNPYSYSDMTGFQLRNFTAPRGLWRTVFDCGYEICGFDELVWEAAIPPGTSVTGRARTSSDGVNWSAWSETSGTSPANIRDLPSGRYCQVELSLATTEDDLSPVVTNVEVFWQRP